MSLSVGYPWDIREVFGSEYPDSKFTIHFSSNKHCQSRVKALDCFTLHQYPIVLVHNTTAKVTTQLLSHSSADSKSDSWQTGTYIQQ